MHPSLSYTARFSGQYGVQDRDIVGLMDGRDFARLPTEDTITMSLPGLQISAPAEIEATPIIHELKEGTEWRFEVAFGSKVEVKVR